MSVIAQIKEKDARTKHKQREIAFDYLFDNAKDCLLYTSPSPRDRTRSRMPSSA